MTFKLKFHGDALQEWHKIAQPLREQFKKKLFETNLQFGEAQSKLSGMSNLYKIKLRATGFRLVYKMEEDCMTVLLLTVGKQNRHAMYNANFNKVTH